MNIINIINKKKNKINRNEKAKWNEFEVENFRKNKNTLVNK